MSGQRLAHSAGCKCGECNHGFMHLTGVDKPEETQKFLGGGSVRDPSSHRTPEQIHTMDHGYNRVHQDRIVERHKARRTLAAEGRVHKGDGMDVDHKQRLAEGGSNARSNWRVRTASANRGWADDA